MLASTLRPIRDRAAFLDALTRSGIVSRRQLDRAASSLTDDVTTADATAEQFVRTGLLTAFQAKRVLCGKIDGYFIGPYCILEPIGEGRGGKVYKARHKTMNRLVAIKLLVPERTRTTEMHAAFQQATRQAVQLLHPHVVTAFDANEVANRIYIVLEYVNGVDLDSQVRRHGVLSIEAACEFARQTALALAHAHERGLAHGCLNPANLLLDSSTEQPRVKVLNFAFGRLAELYANDATNQLNSALSAGDYYAPEQLGTQSPPSAAADLYSLGCVMHYLLTGRPPTGDGPIHQFSNTRPIQHWRGEIPASLAKLIHSLLERDPIHRPQSAMEVALRLEPFARGDYVSHDPTSDSPFATLTDTLANLESPTPVETDVRTMQRPIRAGKRWSGSVFVALGLAAGVILLTGWAIGLVLKSAIR